MAPIVRILKVALAAVGGVLYLWFAGVRNAPRVKARKALRRGR